jgi:hypothetical protein
METQSNENKNASDAGQPAISPTAGLFTGAYERRFAEIQAVTEEQFPALNIDHQSAVATVLGALPEIRALRDDLAKLPNLDMALVDGLEEYAEAAAVANARFVTATTPEEDIVALNEEALKLRETLHTDALALAHRGLIDPDGFKGIQGLVGYKNVGFDLIDWAILMQNSWQKIEGKTALTAAEVEHAMQLGERLVRAAGLREQGPAAVADVARIRQQALALLVNAYDEVRRGLTFLRWREGDVETIAPSLYTGRPRKKPSDPAGEGGGGGNGGTPAPGAQPPPAQAGGASDGGAHPVATPAVSPGLPGSPPFAKA